MNTTATTTALQARWRALAGREQSLVLIAAAVMGLALLWSLALAPALAQLRRSTAQHAQVDGQIQRMQMLQAQAQALSQAPTLRLTDAQRSVQNSLTEHLGASARLQWSAAQANITLTQASASALAAWLAQVRTNAHASVQEMHLQRAPATTSTTTPGNPPATAQRPAVWNGTLVLTVPSGQGGAARPGP